MTKKQLKVQARNCVEDEALNDNVRENLKKIDRWMEPHKLHGRRAMIVSAGPSSKTHIEAIKTAQKEGADIYCVKHSLPLLVENGITPFGCIILDPRDFKGESTHGIVRETLFDNASKETLYFVASMTNPSTVQGLIDKGLSLVGWHAAVGKIQETFKDEIPYCVMGGSSSAVRGISLLNALGYRTVTLVGFDSCMEGKPKDVNAVYEGRPKYLQVEVTGKEFWSTGELICQIQDIEKLFKMTFFDMQIEAVHPQGMVTPIYETLCGRYSNKSNFEEVYEDSLVNKSWPINN
jgi:hypothetical protein